MTTPLSSFELAFSATPVSIWSLTQKADGKYTFPAWISTLSPGESFNWGYIANSKTALTLTSNCGSDGPSTGASQTGTQTGSQTGSATGSSGDASCPLKITQTLVNSWQSEGVTQSQYDVVIKNQGTQSLGSLQFKFAQGLDDFWSLTLNADGSYGFPSWLPSLSSNGEMEFGYIAHSSEPVSIEVTSPSSCSNQSF
eukprot:TRINITY_DN1951_c0_g1_i9.p1 TRINITY_DN1951_c0_g1~~TRINITY_DN1951_c0_g1_i9.p1  ORF type:complete len:197 (-),score=35.33 TRINITY_DN1951_c0_g1_i9:88-678(-)